MNVGALNIISLGAGVQSSTMALMAAHGEITPMPDAAIFADTQAEPRAVYEWLDWLEKQLSFAVYRVTKGDLKAVNLKTQTTRLTAKFPNRKYWRSQIPAYVGGNGNMGPLMRKCTTDFKITPIIQKVRQLRKSKSEKVIQWIGISVDEAARMKPSRVDFIEHRWPLIESNMSREGCKKWMKDHGYPEPPRSACTFCPYHSDREWRSIKNTTPDEFAAVVEYEKEMQRVAAQDTFLIRGVPYLHPSCKPLDQVDFSTDEDRGQLNMFNNECEGMCGV